MTVPKHLLVLDDDPYFVKVVTDLLAEEPVDVLVANSLAEGLSICARHTIDIVLLDQILPDGNGEDVCADIIDANEQTKIILVTAKASIPGAVSAMKRGVYDYLAKPVESDRLRLLVRRLLEVSDLEKTSRLNTYNRNRASQPSWVGASPFWRQLQDEIRIAASSAAPVLITGETGTGKNVLAKLIAKKSRREMLVEVNCAAIPEDLAEAELFGHEKGAFTGADKARSGLFELANGGTIFLDEIGEMPGSLQVKLLAALDTGSIRRLGGREQRRLDVRVIAATNVDVQKEIGAKKFRQDLYYRLAVHLFHIPPLRSRPDDIVAITHHFLEEFGKRNKTRFSISDTELEQLLRYHWPGNVRELRNIVERSTFYADNGAVHPSRFLSPQNEWQGNARPGSSVSDDYSGMTLEEVKCRHIQKTLRHYDGNVTRAARALGVSRTTLQRFLRRYPGSGPRD